NHKITSLVVINEEKHPIGIVRLQDILRAGVV
ncbi:MAG: CBS domain-containing protein, partial [Gammaproteobacteria bacterium]|nr:CBS domain-containing protein [Gammaproteobacteria bacterium]